MEPLANQCLSSVPTAAVAVDLEYPVAVNQTN